MPLEQACLRAGLRWTALAGVVILGIGAIVGSGGGGDAAQCSFFSNVCNPVISPIVIPIPATATASLDPTRIAVRAGARVSFNAQSSGIDQPSYQWRRSADGGMNFVDIAGATSAAFAITAAQFADSGAVFRVDVRGSGSNAVLASSNAGTLLVAALPAVSFTDGEFDPADWSASAIAEPTTPGGPTHSEDRSAIGGLPGAFRHMVHTMTAGPSSLRVFNISARAVYVPQTQGAILAIDYAEDCDRVSASSASFAVTSYPLIEQAGRRYVAARGRGCLSLWVSNFSPLPSLVAADFVRVDGPACGGGETCPDFSASGAPLRFGFERRVIVPAAVPAGSIDHGIDNWKLSVWRQ